MASRRTRIAIVAASTIMVGAASVALYRRSIRAEVEVESVPLAVPEAPATAIVRDRWSLSARAVAVMATSAFLVLAAFAFAPLLAGWKPMVITSGSMGPLVKPGDIVLMDPGSRDVHVNDVVTYRPVGSQQLVTHRIVEAYENGSFAIKGDANLQSDTLAVAPQQIEGKVRLVVPMLGTIVTVWGDHRDVASVVLVVGVAGLTLVALVRVGLDLRRKRVPVAPLLTRRVAIVVGALLVGGVAVGGASAAAFTGSTTNPNSAVATGSFYSQRVMALSPMAYWRLGETSGTAAADQTGTYPGTYTTGYTLNQSGAIPLSTNRAMGCPVQAMQGMTVPQASSPQFTNAFTIAFWWKPSVSQQGTASRLIGNFDNGSNLSYLFAYENGANATTFRFLVQNSANVRVDTTTNAKPVVNNTNRWYFIAGVYTGSSVTLYIDGAAAATVPATGNVKTNPARLILCGETGGTNSARGTLDEVSMHGYALTPAQLTDLFTVGSAT